MPNFEKVRENIQKQGFLKVLLNLFESKLKRDWRGFPLLYKAFILFFYTVFPKFMWKKYPTLVLKALELANSVICQNKKLLDLILITQDNPGFIKPLLSFREMGNLYIYAKKAENLPGDLAEVGVYRGGSAKIISEAKGKKNFHLFDTFAGLPKPDSSQDDLLVKGEMKNTSLKEVKANLKEYSNLYFYKGMFPKTAGPISKRKFSFVHLDVDLYKSTKDCLNFFIEE